MSRIQVDNIFDKEGSGAPSLPAGAVVTGVTTSTTFDGNLTGNVTGNVTGDLTGDVTGTADLASGLTGTPDIDVATIDATTGSYTGIVTATEFDGQTELRTWLFG